MDDRYANHSVLYDVRQPEQRTSLSEDTVSTPGQQTKERVEAQEIMVELLWTCLYSCLCFLS